MTAFTHAICRRPGTDFASGLTTVDLPVAGLGAPDFDILCAQHEAYVATLQECGLTVTVLDALAGFPDAHFIEDTAVVTPRVAVVTRPGHVDRRGEEDSVVAPLSELDRPLVRIAPPGTVDGGDVLQYGHHVFIGVSSRTNASGARQLADILARHGHGTTLVPVGAGLHLKSGLNEVGDALLVTSAFAERSELADCRKLAVPPEEEYAGNTLRINGHLLVPAGYPKTRAMLQELGMPIVNLETSELRKMDGGLTCLSLRYGSAESGA